MIEDLKALEITSLTRLANELMVQPKYESLGLDSTDRCGDAYRTGFVAEFERLYGELKLDSVDIHTHLDSTFNEPKPVSKTETKKVIIDYRNQVLTENILSSKKNKVLVVFGEGHKKGVFKNLKKSDNKWK